MKNRQRRIFEEWLASRMLERLDLQALAIARTKVADVIRARLVGGSKASFNWGPFWHIQRRINA